MSQKSWLNKALDFISGLIEPNINDLNINGQMQAEIFRLKMDHFEELFDWLSLEELVILGKTCKRMQRYVGFYVTTTYAATQFELPKYGSHTGTAYSEIRLDGMYSEIKLNGMQSYMRKFLIMSLNHKDYGTRRPTFIIPYLKVNRFESLTEIHFLRTEFTQSRIVNIKEILGQAEVVTLQFAKFLNNIDEFYESFLQFCPKMKKLCIWGYVDREFIIGRDNSWLLRKYPTLEHFELITHRKIIPELQTFFEQNNQLKRFATDIYHLWANRNAFYNTHLKLDVLSIIFEHNGEYNLYSEFLNKLHKRGNFKQLSAYFNADSIGHFNQEHVNHMISWNGLTKLNIPKIGNGVDLCSLIHLKYLHINRASEITNLTILAKCLVNLELIEFTHAFFDDIQPFVCHSQKLKTIAVLQFSQFFDKFNFDEINFEIEKFNEQRSKLVNARKIIIYVTERVYLAVKWRKHVTNMNLIEIKRGTSYERVLISQSFNFMQFLTF